MLMQGVENIAIGLRVNLPDPLHTWPGLHRDQISVSLQTCMLQIRLYPDKGIKIICFSKIMLTP